MDDDLRAVATLLSAPEPSTDAIEGSQVRLRRRMLDPGRPRRSTWWATGVAVTAAAAVTAVVVTTVGATPPASHHRPGAQSSASRPVRISARQILLTAASSVERAPATHGAYWHVSLVIRDPQGRIMHHSDTWNTRNSDASWERSDLTKDKLVRLDKPIRYRFAGVELTAAQLDELPADPAKLKAWIDDAENRATTLEGPMNRYERKDWMLNSLAGLVSGLPSQPKVRAAAFRALASFPEVRSLGAVDGGQAVVIPNEPAPLHKEARLVVDPATGQVRNTNFFTSGGGVDWVMPPGKATVVGEWTNTPPQ